ncbi:MAG: 4Fe-4S dicluster domain-containing protein [Proteobacteria bacterium]|nr:4Fe-4S dicluster domain-containing protein [Pseudomonadota bacterium]MBU1696502.1 4Fe-4S dicluster domain-containing protein [Pseudomonadota bacterium]
MTCILTSINWIILIGTSVFLLVLSLSSFREKEIRATVISFAFFVLNLIVWVWSITALDRFQTLNLLVVSLLGLFGIVSLIKFFPDKSPGRDTSKAEQYDERNNMFARNNLQHHPELLETYYAIHPENRSTDQQIHQKPEFGEKEQVYHDFYTAPCYEAAFEYLEKSIPLSTGSVSEQKISIDPIQFCKTIIDLSKFYGACDVAFCHLLPHHFYSHKGRHAANWGDKTDQTHKTAIAIVVPMRVEMVKKGPTSCMIQESAQKYVEAAKISNILASYIRNFGYPARAHNDANYDTLCVPLAVESGLGELGRMGIFMHRVHGPCVRLAIVTTDLELPDSPIPKPLYMEEFCKICKKCADNCPSGSITHDGEPYSRNLRHWSIHQEKCFSYWKTIGSDCGLCISVCPYTKPDTLIHKFVRFYISRNLLNQKIALFMDDLLYGRHRKIARTNPENIF